jgi:hypothetical protein
MPPLKNPKKLAVIFLATSPSKLQQNSRCKRAQPYPKSRRAERWQPFWLQVAPVLSALTQLKGCSDGATLLLVLTILTLFFMGAKLKSET